MRGTPLISIRVPSVTLTFTSCRAAPIPVRTQPVLRTSRRQISPTWATSRGVRMSGPVTVSMRGMPRRSVRYTRRWPTSLTSRQASSSSPSWTIRTSRSLNGIRPLTPTMVVRWNPVGMLPSRYCLRAMWISSTMEHRYSMAMPRAISSASSLSSNGGVSSIS